MLQIIILSLAFLNSQAAAQQEEPIEAKPAHAPAKSAVDGCRDPRIPYNDVSCDVCCDQNLDNCLEYSGDEWYNSIEYFYAQDCPDACPKCASCFSRDEDNLKKLVPPEGCNPADCETMDIGVDPCFARGSCECFCETANDLMAKCPQVEPSWVKNLPTPTVKDEVPTIEAPSSTESGDVLIGEVPSSSTETSPVVIDEIPPFSPPSTSESTVECSERDRLALIGLNPPAQCNPQDCAAMDVGVDPCFGFGSCECFCDMMNGLVQRCPDVEPKWVASESKPTDTLAPTDAMTPSDTMEPTDLPTDVTDTIGMDTFTMTGPWNLEDIQGEKISLMQIYTRTLQVAPFTTVVSIARFKGLVQIQFTTTAFSNVLKRLHTEEFKRQLNANILSTNQDLARSLFIHETDVVGYFAMEGFWEISQVQKFQEDLRMIFASTLKVDPDSVEEEITKNGKIVQILFEIKGRPIQLAPLYFPDRFSQSLNTNIAAVNPILALTLRLVVCPPVPPTIPNCQGNMVCRYGQECCCGNCFPSEVYTCAGGQWNRMFTDACMGGCGLSEPSPDAEPETPQIEPSPGLQKSAPKEQTVQKGMNYTHLALLMTFSVILGIVSALILQKVCTKKRTPLSEQTDNLYHDISLDTDVLARSV